MQTSWSSQSTGSLVHAPFTQRSFSVQALESAQSASVVQQLGAPTLWQPVDGSQESLVHELLSSQFRGVLGAQLPLEHFSMPLHRLVPPHPSPSDTGLWTQPPLTPGSQESVVQGFVSSQLSGSLTHRPESQRSLVVHGVLSAQSALVLQQPGVPW